MKRLYLGLATAAVAAAFAAGSITAGEGTFDRNTGSFRSGQNVYQQAAQKDAPYLVVPRKMPTSGTPYELHMVQTHDEIYVPLGVRKPEGNGPFPAVLIGSGNGVGGFTRVERAMYRLEPMMDEMLKRGYVVAFANYRNEIPQMYNQIAGRAENIEDEISGGARALKSTATLDSDDFVSHIEHLQGLPYVRPDAVGTIGVSHTGELQTKAAAMTTWAAAVPIEGASYEFLAVDVEKAPKKDGVMHLEDRDLVKKISDKEVAMERIKKIRTPFLHLGRDADHLQGVFGTVHDWMTEAGTNESTWVSVNHDVHGYGLLYRNDDGSYTPDAMQREIFDTWMAFFDKKLKKIDTAAR